MSGEPHPKSTQLARGERKRGRIVATRREWATIRKAKQGPCRVCVNVRTNGHDYGVVELHHLLPRARGGDDLEENIAPLHSRCHERITAYDPAALEALAGSLTEAEREYLIGKLGPSALERLYGVIDG